MEVSLSLAFFISLPSWLSLTCGPTALTPVWSSREASACAGACSPGHLLQGQRFNTPSSFTATCQSTCCLGFLAEMFIPSRYSVISTQSLGKTSCWCKCETSSGQQPLLQDLGIASLSLGSFSPSSPLSLPSIGFQTPTLLCHQHLFYASSPAVLHQFFPSVVQHLKAC